MPRRPSWTRKGLKTTKEDTGSNRFDAHKGVKGRKRYLVFDTLGLRLSTYATSAVEQGRVGARLLLAGL